MAVGCKCEVVGEGRKVRSGGGNGKTINQRLKEEMCIYIAMTFQSFSTTTTTTDVEKLSLKKKIWRPLPFSLSVLLFLLLLQVFPVVFHIKRRLRSVICTVFFFNKSFSFFFCLSQLRRSW